MPQLPQVHTLQILVHRPTSLPSLKIEIGETTASHLSEGSAKTAGLVKPTELTSSTVVPHVLLNCSLNAAVSFSHLSVPLTRVSSVQTSETVHYSGLVTGLCLAGWTV